VIFSLLANRNFLVGINTVYGRVKSSRKNVGKSNIDSFTVLNFKRELNYNCISSICEVIQVRFWLECILFISF